MTTIKPVGYILAVGTGGNLFNLDLYSIEQYSDSKPVEYNLISVLGRATPVVVWNSGQARKLNLTIKLFANRDAKTEVYDKIEQLRKLAEPQQVSDRYVIPPPLVIAKAFAYKIRGVVENLSIGGGDIPPVAGDELYPIVETVQLEITEVRD